MEKNEKSEKRRFSMKPKIETNDKPKERRKSQMLKTPKKFDDQQPNIMNPNMIAEQGMQAPVPVLQQQYYAMQPGYGVPVMVNGMPGQAYPPYLANQTTPLSYAPLKFGFGPAQIVCPYCQVAGPTKIDESFNFCTCFIYIFIIMLIPILIVLAAYSGCTNVHCNNGCDCDCTCCYCGTCDCKCCIDTNHYCSNCGKRIGTRDSCQELCPCFTSCYC